MSVLTIAPIVEGHGEVQAIRTLLQRAAASFESDCVVDVLQPIRVSKFKIIADDVELLRAIDLAKLKLSTRDQSGSVLLVLDADRDAACVLGPRFRDLVRHERGHVDFFCVIAVIEYETWLVAGANSLDQLLVPGFREAIPPDPEGARCGKGWIEQFFSGRKYSETVDQARLTARFDLEQARLAAPSFDRLCRELAKRCVS